MREMGHTVVLDPFTVGAARGYPVGSNVKALPPLPTCVPLWGTVVRNDGTTFGVAWAFIDRTDTYDLAVERARHAEVCAMLSRECFDPVGDWIDDGGLANCAGVTPMAMRGESMCGVARRVIRGGCFWSHARWCRAAFRDVWLPVVRFGHLGFRPAMKGEQE
jgi:hypothetical protein